MVHCAQFEKHCADYCIHSDLDSTLEIANDVLYGFSFPILRDSFQFIQPEGNFTDYVKVNHRLN